MFHGGFRLNNLAREMINQVNCSEKGLIPILKRHRCICKKKQTDFYNMSMLTLSRAILLMCVRTRNKMGNTHTLEKGVKFLILASPIGLHCKDFLIK
jgi:hypothetical protein